jgi:hypothetical protein
MHDPELPASPTCSHESIFEYWHENKTCDLDNCGVNECDNCGVFATECGQVSKV